MKRLDEIGNMDLTTEDGYRDWSKAMVSLCKEQAGELSFSAGLLFQLLSVTPVAQARTSRLAIGDDSKAYAKQVRQYLNRAAQATEFAGAQVAGAWSRFENGFLVPSGTRAPGMSMNRAGARKRGA